MENVSQFTTKQPEPELKFHSAAPSSLDVKKEQWKLDLLTNFTATRLGSLERAISKKDNGVASALIYETAVVFANPEWRGFRDDLASGRYGQEAKKSYEAWKDLFEKNPELKAFVAQLEKAIKNSGWEGLFTAKGIAKLVAEVATPYGTWELSRETYELTEGEKGAGKWFRRRGADFLVGVDIAFTAVGVAELVKGGVKLATGAVRTVEAAGKAGTRAERAMEVSAELFRALKEASSARYTGMFNFDRISKDLNLSLHVRGTNSMKALKELEAAKEGLRGLRGNLKTAKETADATRESFGMVKDLENLVKAQEGKVRLLKKALIEADMTSGKVVKSITSAEKTAVKTGKREVYLLGVDSKGKNFEMNLNTVLEKPGKYLFLSNSKRITPAGIESFARGAMLAETEKAAARLSAVGGTRFLGMKPVQIYGAAGLVAGSRAIGAAHEMAKPKTLEQMMEEQMAKAAALGAVKPPIEPRLAVQLEEFTRKRLEVKKNSYVPEFAKAFTVFNPGKENSRAVSMVLYHTPVDWFVKKMRQDVPKKLDDAQRRAFVEESDRQNVRFLLDQKYDGFKNMFFERTMQTMDAWKYGKLPHRKLERLERIDDYFKNGARTAWEERRRENAWELLMKSDQRRFAISKGTTDSQLDAYVQQLEALAMKPKK